jgi:hypothetical protein
MLATSYTLSSTSELEHADAVERVRDDLKAEGFGVLCEIDVQATLKDKLGVDGERMLSLVDNDALAPIAAQVRDKLARVIEHAATS